MSKKEENKFKSEFEFTLYFPITYQGDREDEKTNLLLLKAPSNKHTGLTNSIAELVINSLLGMSKKVVIADSPQEQKNDTQITGEQMLFALTANKNIDEVSALFSKLLCDGCCYINKKIAATEWHISQIKSVPPVNDFQELMGKYFENFIIASWTTRLLQNGIS